ncbi:EamA family transporter, partial [bacterium]|nr:EamA family transporter [bacterium]
LWAFSFGLIKRFLPGLDPWWVATVRLLLATLAFAPWLVRLRLAATDRVAALLLGGLQFGVMYVCYLASYRYLAAWQVALWTVFTPILVVLVAQAWRRRVQASGWLAAVLAVVGAILAQGQLPTGETLRGVLLVQASNLAFAIGQLGFGPLARRAGIAGPRTAGREAGLVGWMSMGGAVLAAGGALVAGRPPDLAGLGAASPVLLYLGLVPTALGFWAWNRGAARVDAGQLGVANNLKIPLAVIVSWVVFGEAAAYGRALGGLVIIVLALVWLTGRPRRSEGPGSS